MRFSPFSGVGRERERFGGREKKDLKEQRALSPRSFLSLFESFFSSGEYSGLEHEVVPGVVESLKVITRAASTRVVRVFLSFLRFLRFLVFFPGFRGKEKTQSLSNLFDSLKKKNRPSMPLSTPATTAARASPPSTRQTS